MSKISSIKKRNGHFVPFDPEKIHIAIKKAFTAQNVGCPEKDVREMSETVVRTLEEKFKERELSVEDTQDTVERVIMESGYFDVAKAYILYRYEHTEKRKEETAKEIEERRLMVKARNGEAVAFDDSKVRAELSQVAKDYEDEIPFDELIDQLKYELYDGIPTVELQKALILVLRSRIERDPAYSKMASRLLLRKMYRDVLGKYVDDPKERRRLHGEVFARNIRGAVTEGTLDSRMGEFDFTLIGDAFMFENDDLFEYMGLEILSSRYCMEDRKHNLLETPQMVWMRVAMGVALAEKQKDRMARTKEFYEVLSNFYYTPGGRTLFQAGFKKAQLSNCFINVVPDDLDAIFKSFSDNAQYLKWSGGTGTSWTPVRATGAYIKGTGVGSQGIVPFLKIANDVNGAINRSGKRRGAGCVYLETWHLDIEAFLELRKNTGDERRRTHDINTANWVPDLFMKRVRDGKEWTLFSPEEVPDLHEKYGKTFEEAYVRYEKKADEGKITLFKRVKASDLWKKMLGMLFETGHPWITFKDPCNVRSPQDHVGVVHSSNLCTEITLNTSPNETAVCNIGSLNFALFIKDGRFDNELVGKVVRVAIRMLDNVIDLNYYPTPDAKRSNMRHRPVGLGVRGYHDALYQLGISFDTPEAVQFADESMEVVAYHAILSSSELAKERGTYETFKGSKWDRDILPQDTIPLLAEERGEPIDTLLGGKLDWSPVREHIKKHGMRNSNTMAIAPTASTANLVGCIPCVEPIYKNIYVKSNKEGDFTVVNKYLIYDLKKCGLWDTKMLEKLKFAGGSLQDIPELPIDLKEKYKETFEVDAKWLIDAAAARGKWIDQSQSINIFYQGASGKEISDAYFHAWTKGLKTTYYLRTLGASQVEKSTVSTSEYGSTHERKAFLDRVGKSTEKTMEKQTGPVASTYTTAVREPLSVGAAAQSLERKGKSSQVAVTPRYSNLTRIDDGADCESCQA